MITHEDDDKAMFVWRCKGQGERPCEGEAEWTGGTGEYTGLKGSQMFSVVVRSTGNEGHTIFKGQWQLPE